MAATRKLQQSGLELQASATGEQATQRAQESRTRNVQQSANRAEQGRQFDESTNQRELDRWQRQWEEKRANDLRQQQLSEQSRQFDVSTSERGRQFDEGQALTAADRGLERTGGGQQPQQDGGQPRIGNQPAMGTQGGPDPRMAAMQAEMARGRQQMSQGIEQGTQGRGYVKTEGRQQAEAKTEARAQSDSESRRIAAVASYKRATDAYRIAEMRMQGSSSAAGRAQEMAALKEIKSQLMQPIKSSVKTMDRMMNHKGTLQDWQSVRAEVAGAGERAKAGANYAQLFADAQGGIWTDRLQTFLQQKVVAQGLKYIRATGVLPDGDVVDMSSPGMQEFTKAAYDAAILNDPSVAGPGQLLSFQDQAARLRYINRQAAWTVLNRKPTMGAGGDQGAGGEAPLNAAAPGAKPAQPTHSQRAGPSGRVPPGGQINPEEAKRRAAEPVPIEAPQGPGMTRRQKAGGGEFEGVPGLGGDPGHF